MKKMSNIITIILLIIILVLIAGVTYGYYKKATIEVKNPIVTMEVQDFGTIKLELYPEIAPETVANFITLAQNGFYNGLKFHRVVDGFMIQGGDKNGDGSGSPTLKDLGINENGDKEYCIPGEFVANGYNNTIKHKEGVISMARADYTGYSSSLTNESYNSGGSQFFIMTKDNDSLNGFYAGFGKVIEGMDVVHAIEKTEVKANDEEKTEGSEQSESEKSIPVNDVIIKKVTVNTFGAKYNKPKTLDVWDYNQWIYQTYGIDLNSYQ